MACVNVHSVSSICTYSWKNICCLEALKVLLQDEGDAEMSLEELEQFAKSLEWKGASPYESDAGNRVLIRSLHLHFEQKLLWVKLSKRQRSKVSTSQRSEMYVYQRFKNQKVSASHGSQSETEIKDVSTISRWSVKAVPVLLRSCWKIKDWRCINVSKMTEIGRCLIFNQTLKLYWPSDVSGVKDEKVSASWWSKMFRSNTVIERLTQLPECRINVVKIFKCQRPEAWSKA